MAASSKPKIGIVGLGMVGGPIKKWLEEFKGYRCGKNLFCYDADAKKGFTDDVNRADIIFISVPTPPNNNGSCNTSIVEYAVSQIKNGKIVVIKSTVTPGTVQKLQNKYPGKKFIFNPEFLTESKAWEDFISPDRQIVATTVRSRSHSSKVLKVLPQAPNNIKEEVNVTEAEMAKYASNVFGFIKVAYGNILADLCHAMTIAENTKVKYDIIRTIVSADERIGPAWLNVDHGNYCGAGGYCFPKDMKAFIKFAEKATTNAGNKKIDPVFLKVLRRGVNVLKAVQDYNIELLKAQGLTVADVSKHDNEIILQKRGKIRKQ